MSKTKIIISEQAIFEYYEKFLSQGRQVSAEFVAKRFGISAYTVSVKVRKLIADGKLIKAGFEVFLPGDTRAEKERQRLQNGKRFDSVATREKKSQAGVAGAEALKRLAFEKGMQRFQVGLAKDSEAIQKRIDAIVANAEGTGTSYRKNFVYCQGVKRG